MRLYQWQDQASSFLWIQQLVTIENIKTCLNHIRMIPIKYATNTTIALLLKSIIFSS